MSNEDWPWSDEQKRDYVWTNLKEAAQRTESNTASYFAYLVKNDGEYKPTFLSQNEQYTILQDFDAEGKIRLIGKHPDEKHVYDFELLEPNRKRPSVYSDRIKTIADLIKDIKLRIKVMGLLAEAFDFSYDTRGIKATQIISMDVLESNDEILILMDELGLTKTNWESVQRPTHRVIGNRYVNVVFKGDIAKKLVDAVSGRSSFIRTKALELIALLAQDLMSQDDLNDFFLQLDVPCTLLSNQNTKKDLIYNVIFALSSTGGETDKSLFFHILEEFAHPLVFTGDTKKALDFQYKITKIIRFDGFSLLDGKIHVFSEIDETRMAEFEHEEEKENQKISKTNDEINTKKLGLITSLTGKQVSFNDNEAQIIIDNKNCSLPPHKNEHDFCRAIFEYPKNEPVDWSLIYEKANRQKITKDGRVTKEKRGVYDSMNAVNKRIMKVFNTNDKLFLWRERTITRMF